MSSVSAGDRKNRAVRVFDLLEETLKKGNVV